MRPTDLLRTSAFRLTLVYLAVLAVFAFAGFRYLYSESLEALQFESRQTVAAELEGLAEHYRQFGPRQLRAIVNRRVGFEDRSLYLLVDRWGRKAAGNLGAWPETSRDSGRWREFHYRRAHNGEPSHRHTARAYVADLPGGFRLLVGHDIEEEVALSRRIVVFGAAAGGLILLAGLAAGFLVSRDLRRRVEAVDETGRRIMEDGDLSRRVQVTGRGDEFDDLATSLNRMLGRIELLMNELREVTDNVAHDLRRPLARLHARLEDVLRGPPEAGAYRDALERTVAEVQELMDTFNMLLAIARAESGPAAPVPVDLAALAEDLAELHAPSAAERGIELEFAKEGRAPKYGDSRNCWPRRSPTSSTTPSNTPRKAAGSRSPSAPPALPWPTAAPASRRKTGSACSNASCASTRAANCPATASAWHSPPPPRAATTPGWCWPTPRPAASRPASGRAWSLLFPEPAETCRGDRPADMMGRPFFAASGTQGRKIPCIPGAEAA